MIRASLALIVEDRPSEAVARKLLKAAAKPLRVDNVLRWSKDTIRMRIHSVNRAARGYPWFVLTDQDTGERCPPVALAELAERRHPNLMYRFATMEVESWILADRKGVSAFLHVPVHRIPLDTDALPRPKEFLVGLARKSRSKRIRTDMTPRPGSTSRVGPDYNGRLSEFVAEVWDYRAASAHSESLRRSLRRIESFAPSLPQEAHGGERKPG